MATGAAAIAQGGAEAQQVRDVRAEFNAAIARQDVPGIVSFLDSEYQVTTSLGQLSQDVAAEADAWRELFATREDLLYVRSPESVDISRHYPLAAESGTWVGTWSTTDGVVRTGGRYAAMWRKVDDKWRVRSELFVALYCEGSNCP